MPGHHNRGAQLWVGLGLLVLLGAWAASTQQPPQSPTASTPEAGTAADQQRALSPMPPLSGEPQLMERLAIADQQWRPRREPMPNGGFRYVYRKRAGDPDLSLAQIKALMANPPTFQRERWSIVNLWGHLSTLGVLLHLEQPRKFGAAGEWDPAARTLRIQPAVVAKGSAEFAQVLNHESIHVAQSCRSGSLHARPRPLGLPQELPSTLQTVLQDPTYAKTTARERELEREAYANQHQLDLGLSLLKIHC